MIPMKPLHRTFHTRPRRQKKKTAKNTPDAKAAAIWHILGGCMGVRRQLHYSFQNPMTRNSQIRPEKYWIWILVALIKYVQIQMTEPRIARSWRRGIQNQAA
jgi:hypothetical protein